MPSEHPEVHLLLLGTAIHPQLVVSRWDEMVVAGKTERHRNMRALGAISTLRALVRDSIWNTEVHGGVPVQ